MLAHVFKKAVFHLLEKFLIGGVALIVGSGRARRGGGGVQRDLVRVSLAVLTLLGLAEDIVLDLLVVVHDLLDIGELPVEATDVAAPIVRGVRCALPLSGERGEEQIRNAAAAAAATAACGRVRCAAAAYIVEREIDVNLHVIDVRLEREQVVLGDCARVRRIFDNLAEREHVSCGGAGEEKGEQEG